MYNLAKLLTEEPKKIEKLLILLSKLIIILFITSSLYGFTTSLSALIENPLPKELTTIKVIYFFASIVIVWYVVWNILIEGLLTQFPIWLITRKKTGENTVNFFFSMLGIAHRFGSHYVRGENIIAFTQNLKQDEIDELDEIDSRQRQYYQLSLITLIALLLFGNIKVPGWTIYFFMTIIVGSFVASVLLSLCCKYIRDNYDALKRELIALAYAQKVSNMIRETKVVREYCEVTDRNLEIDIVKKENTADVIPPQITVRTFYHRSSEIASAQIVTELNEIRESIAQHNYVFIFCNVAPSNTCIEQLRKIDRVVLITAKNQAHILTGFEEALCRIGVDLKIRPLSRIATKQ